ncbi:unnamed protein product [Prorocentrum cordatum]|uniref:Uncharacterized protein n=1 Tax=Prorocentrum cordatum TaxID=2364126 RepID=A0ABN9VFS5_9DINO|nr:unnamed protein product [Polarella glacialis]
MPTTPSPLLSMAELQGLRPRHGAAPRPPGFGGQVRPPQVFAQKLKSTKEEDCGVPPGSWIATPQRRVSETERGRSSSSSGTSAAATNIKEELVEGNKGDKEEIKEGARDVAKENDAWPSVVQLQAAKHKAEELAAVIQAKVAARGGAVQPQRGCGSGTRVEETVLKDVEKDCMEEEESCWKKSEGLRQVWHWLVSRVLVEQMPTKDEPPKERSTKQERLERKHEELQGLVQRSRSVSIRRDLHRIELGQAVAAAAEPKATPKPRFPSSRGAAASAGCAVAGGYEVEYTGKYTLRDGSAGDLSAGPEEATGVRPALHSSGREAEEPGPSLGGGQESVGQCAPTASAKSRNYKKREKKEKITESGLAQRLLADYGLAYSEEMVHVASGAVRRVLVGVPQSLRLEVLETLQNKSFDLFED